MFTYHPSHKPNTKALAALAIATILGGAVCLLVLAKWWPDPYAYTWEIITGQLLIGRAFSLSLGLNQGFSKGALFWICTYVGAATVIVMYPLLVEGHTRLSEMRYVGNFLKRTRERSIAMAQRMGGLGPIGLMLFVCFPLWNTGPVVGAMVGYLFGIRTWLVLLSVIIGNSLAIAGWLWVLAYVEQILLEQGYEKIPLWVPIGFAVLVIVSGAGYKVYQWWAARRNPPLPPKVLPEAAE